MARYGLLADNEKKLDYVLRLTLPKILERRLQTRIYKEGGLAKSIHHARCLIRGRHIRVGKDTVNAAQFRVRVDSEKKVDFTNNSPFGGGKPGRVKRKSGKRAAAKKEVAA